MASNVLIFFPHRLAQRHGGPYSMLYHLQQGLQAQTHIVDFLPSLIDFSSPKKHSPPSFFASIKKALRRLMPERWLLHRQINRWLAETDRVDSRITSTVDLSEYDVLHFHETIDVWRYRSVLENFKGVIVLTSHTPKPYHLELVEDVMGKELQKIGSSYYRKLEEIDQFAYSSAHHLVFPCEEATESYIERWPLFKRLAESQKMKYIPTGVLPSTTNVAPAQVRLDLGIPSEAFVVTFIGRKLSVKGYDFLVSAAKVLLAAHEDIYFIIVGKKGEKPAIENRRWIETGWTDDPFSFVQAGDLHVVPNRYTNFDLNILEVLSLGKPLLLSDTGGNKHFRKFNPEGIFYHLPTEENLIKGISVCYNKRKDLNASGKSNTALYEQHFTAQRFAADHLRFYESIVK